MQNAERPAEKTAAGTVVIVGCGALGSVFAGLMASAGLPVLAVCRSLEQRDALVQNGLLLVEDGERKRVPLSVCAELPGGENYALVIVLVKAFDTAAAVESLASRIGARTPVVTLQNGVGNAEVLGAHLRPEQVLAGATTFGAEREAPGVVRLTGRGGRDRRVATPGGTTP